MSRASAPDLPAHPASFVGRERGLAAVRPAPPVAVPVGAGDAHRIATSPALGREQELSYLRAALDAATAATRRIVFVAGEAGAGKTTLLRAFRGHLDAGAGVRVAQGQCIEHRGTGEAYLPVLDALGRLCRGPDGGAVVPLLARQAPSWLVHLPALVGEAQLADLHRRTVGATGERMLREMGEAVETLTLDRPLLLILEDLHWSDHATLDLLE